MLFLWFFSINQVLEDVNTRLVYGSTNTCCDNGWWKAIPAEVLEVDVGMCSYSPDCDMMWGVVDAEENCSYEMFF